MKKYRHLFLFKIYSRNTLLLLATWYLDPLEVDSVHNGSLEEGNGGEVSLDQTLQLQPRRGPGHQSARLASSVLSTFNFKAKHIYS